MASSENAADLLNSMFKEVTEQQWETFKRSTKTSELVLSELMSDCDDTDIEDDYTKDEQLIIPRDSVKTSINEEFPTVLYINNKITFDQLTGAMEKHTESLEAEISSDPKVPKIDEIHVEVSEPESDSSDSDPQWVPSETKRKKPKRVAKKKPKSKLSQTLFGLVGEANLSFARGAHDDAILMCLEVIRQAPTSAEPFLTLGMIYEDINDMEKAYQFNLIAAYLSPSNGEHWVKVADMAVDQGNLEQAISCLRRAIRLNPKNIELHLQRCQLLQKVGNIEKALEGYISLLKSIDQKDGEVALILAKEIAKIYFAREQISLSLEVMESTFEKFHSFIASEDVNLYLELLISEKQYLKALSVLNKYCGIHFEINGIPLESYEILVSTEVEARISFDVLPVDLRSKLIVCLINLRCFKSVKNLLKVVTSESAEEMSDLYLEIADAYYDAGLFSDSEPLLVAAMSSDNSPNVLLKYARCCRNLCKYDESILAYQELIKKSPSSHNAKLELTDLFISLGRKDDATSSSNQSIDETVSLDLLRLRCNLLYSQEMWKDFIFATKLLLTNDMTFLSSEQRLMTATVTTCKRRLKLKKDETEPDFIGEGLSFHDFMDMYLKFCKALKKLNENEELTRFVLSAFTSPYGCKGDEHKEYLDFYAVMTLLESREDKYSYSLLKNLLTKDPNNIQLWNIFAALTSTTFQDLRHNRFCLRLFLKNSENRALAYFNAHNALMSGSYKHALGEYVYLHKQDTKDPLAVLCVAIGFMHLICQKFITIRHSVFIQMCAFLEMYINLRGECQESYYNIGRAFHQIGLLSDAVHFYNRALEVNNKIDGDDKVSSLAFAKLSEILDLSREIAYNLALIYKKIGSNELALSLLCTYFTV